MTQDKSRDEFEKWVTQYGHSDHASLRAAWQASESRILELMKSDRAVEAMATAFTEAGNRRGCVSLGDQLKAALAALIKEFE